MNENREMFYSCFKGNRENGMFHSFNQTSYNFIIAHNLYQFFIQLTSYNIFSGLIAKQSYPKIYFVLQKVIKRASKYFLTLEFGEKTIIAE